MKFKNLKRWKLVPELDGLLFFAQRMEELLFDYSLDTYKPAALNASFLCIEALGIVDDIEEGAMDIANLRPIVEELEWSIQNDKIAKELLQLPATYYLQDIDTVKISEVKLKLEVLGRTLDPHRYLERCYQRLHEHVRQSEKKNIETVAKNIVTTLLNLGMSKQILYERTREFFFAPDGSDLESVDALTDFLEFIYPYSHLADVYFVVSALIRKAGSAVDEFDISILDALPEECAAIAQVYEFAPGPDQVVVQVGDVRAHDVYSARDKAVRRLESLGDLFTLFHHKARIAWRSDAIVKQCCLATPVLARVSKGAMEKAFDMPPEKSAKQLGHLLKNSALKEASFERFSRVADLHGTCVSTDIVENQLVNLWTGFETLIPSRVGTNKINNVIASTLPFLLPLYIRRLVERFTYDIFIWDKWRAKKLLNKVPTSSGKSMAKRALILLCDPACESLREDLYTQVKDFHLLRFRAFQLSNALRSGDEVTKILKAHEKKVSWQLRRIYRTRNLIVHSGKTPSFVPTIIENGHDYLDQVMFEIMKMACGDFHVMTIAQAFELAYIRYQAFTSKLKNAAHLDASNCGFLCEDFDAHLLVNTPDWKSVVMGSTSVHSTPPISSTVPARN